MQITAPFLFPTNLHSVLRRKLRKEIGEIPSAIFQLKIVLQYRGSVTRWLVYFFNFWPFATMKISPIMSQICQSRLIILPNKK